MSTLKVNTLTDTAATKLVPIEDVVNGVARAWVNFNGTSTVAIRASYNVTDIDDNGTGDYTVNFTNALSDANYSVVGIGGDYSTVNNTPVFQIRGTPSTSSFNARTPIGSSSSHTDREYIQIAIFR